MNESTKGVIDWILRVVIVLALVLGVWNAWDVQRGQDAEEKRNDCQAAYNEATNRRSALLQIYVDEERTRVRAAEAAEDDLSLDPAVGKENRTVAEQDRIRQKFLKYQDARREKITSQTKADEAREANKLPPPPSVTCEE